MQSYNSILVSFLVLFFYFGSWLMVKMGKIRLVNHRKFWNITLLISFLISGILGLILAIMIDQKMSLSWYRGMLWWHVEAGIVMAIISVFHAAWHVNYYRGVFKNKNL